MQWGGSLGEIIDSAAQIPVAVRSFGTFEPGTAGDPALQHTILEAVRAAVAQHGGAVLELSARTRDSAAVASATLAARGVVGELVINALTISPEDHERLQAAATAAAMARIRR